MDGQNLISRVTVKYLHRLRNQSPNTCVVDVREELEYEEERVPATLHAALSHIEKYAKRIPREGAVYLLCWTGKRALAAALRLMEMGFRNLFVVEGGLEAWKRAGYPIERDRIRSQAFGLAGQIRWFFAGGMALGFILCSLPWFFPLESRALMMALSLTGVLLVVSCMKAGSFVPRLVRVPRIQVSGKAPPAK